MSTFSVSDFVGATAQRDQGHGLFELETDRFLEVNLNGRVWTKMGSMVAYRGNVRFRREGLFEHGVKRLVKRAVTGEKASFTKAEGQGILYLADGGKKISVLKLQDEALFVNGNDLLAFEDSVRWDIRFVKKVGAMMAGGLFNVRLEGAGMVAITTHFDPLTLRVTPGNPITTDPNATIAWSGSLTPDFHADISFKTFLGRGSGESIQMRFEGEGFVVVQPFEEVPGGEG